MAPHSWLVGSDNKENQSDASSNLTKIFSDDGSDSDFISDLEIDSDHLDHEDEDELDDNITNDEGQLPPEHYLVQAESLNVSRLQQKRYSDTTQERIDETCMYWNR